MMTKMYLKPGSIAEALELARANEPDFRFLAGGTDVIPNKFHCNDKASCLIDISSIAELKKMGRKNDHLVIGSLCTLAEISASEEIKTGFPLLAQAALAVASPLIRNRATIGGNVLCENRCIFYNQSEWWRKAVGYCLKCEGDICIATGGKKNCFSKFVSDMAVALISLDTCVEMVEPGGGYRARLEDMYTGDGLSPRKIKPLSVLKAFHIPLNQGFRSVFKKLRQRQSIEFSSLTTAVTVNKFGKLKIVLGGVDPRPVVIESSASGHTDDLIKEALRKSRTVDNDVFSRNYRRKMIALFLTRSFNELGIKK